MFNSLPTGALQILPIREEHKHAKTYRAFTLFSVSGQKSMLCCHSLCASSRRTCCSMLIGDMPAKSITYAQASTRAGQVCLGLPLRPRGVQKLLQTKYDHFVGMLTA